MPSDTTVSDTKLYQVIPGSPALVRIEIGDGQVGGTSLMIDGREWPATEEWEQIGTEGEDLSFRVLHCVTTVRDVSELTNHTSVTYTLRGGAREKVFPYHVEVSEKGHARYIIDFVFVP